MSIYNPHNHCSESFELWEINHIDFCTLKGYSCGQCDVYYVTQ